MLLISNCASRPSASHVLLCLFIATLQYSTKTYTAYYWACHCVIRIQFTRPIQTFTVYQKLCAVCENQSLLPTTLNKWLRTAADGPGSSRPHFGIWSLCSRIVVSAWVRPGGGVSLRLGKMVSQSCIKGALVFRGSLTIHTGYGADPWGPAPVILTYVFWQ